MGSSSKKPSSTLRDIFKAAALPLVLAAALGTGAGAYSYGTQETIQITITGEHSALLHKGEGFGIHKTVYETNKGAFSNTTDPLVGKFSRSAMAKELKIGQTYTVTVNGINMPALGIYKNIIAATPAPKR